MSSVRAPVLVALVLVAGCTSLTPNLPASIEVSLNSTTPILGDGPVAIWVFLPESVRACPSGVAVGMLAFGNDRVFGEVAIEDALSDVLSAGTFLLTRFPGEGPESSAQFFPPNGTRSVVVYVEQARVADPVIYTVANATWHERAAGGWERMPRAGATLNAPCAVEVE